MSPHKVLTRTALLLALTLIFQSLRFIIPIPPFLSTFIVGSLVNSVLLITVETVGVMPAILIASVAPVVAYFQMLLPLPIFILPVALGNIAYIYLFSLLICKGRQWAVGIAACGKTALIYGLFTWLITLVAIPAKLAAAIMLAMSWPQLVTGILGGMLAVAAVKRINTK